MQSLNHNQRDQRRAEQISQRRKKQAAGKVPNRVAQIQFQPAFEQHENNRERSQQAGGLTQSFGVQQMQSGAEQDAEQHQQHDVGNAGNSEEAVGQKREHEQCSQQSQGHRPMRSQIKLH